MAEEFGLDQFHFRRGQCCVGHREFGGGRLRGGKLVPPWNCTRKSLVAGNLPDGVGRVSAEVDDQGARRLRRPEMKGCGQERRCHSRIELRDQVGVDIEEDRLDHGAIVDATP
ncbi:unnamed protein product, partial [Mesorhabditis spiculigera]